MELVCIQGECTVNVRELREWLKQFDQEASVEIVYHSRGHGYYDQGGNATTKEFEPDTYNIGDNLYCHKNHFEYVKFSGGHSLLLGAYES